MHYHRINLEDESDADFQASRFQLLYYLKKLRDKRIIKKGKLTFLEKNKLDKKNYEILLDLTSEKELLKFLKFAKNI